MEKGVKKKCLECRYLQESQIKGVYGCEKNVFIGSTILDLGAFALCKKFKEKADVRQGYKEG